MLTYIREARMNDVHKPEIIDISISKNPLGGITIYANVDGVCLLRVVSPINVSIEVLGETIFSETKPCGITSYSPARVIS